VLGESCEVWNVSRTIRDSELANFSCVTADGIELASWLVTPRGIRHSAEATHLERRPVLPEDAQPPRGLLDLRSWMAPADAAASPESPGPEYDVVLETAIEPGPSTRTKNMRITRRNPNWMLNDTWRGNGRDLSIRHLATGLHVTAHSTTRGVFERLTIDKGPGPIEAIGPGAHAIAERQSETILGESCAWYNVTPGMADGGLHQCWTDDGIVLKEKRYSRGSRETLEAVRLERRPIRDEEVTPPPDILDRRHFGLPE
jgi:hypothetical protein